MITLHDLSPAFPFPKDVRIGVLDDVLVVEHLGPEQENEDSIAIRGIARPETSLLEFFGVELHHLKPNVIELDTNIEDMAFFRGDSLNYSCDYFYDFTKLQTDSFALNGVFYSREFLRLGHSKAGRLSVPIRPTTIAPK